jgi:cold shock CspA family protein
VPGGREVFFHRSDLQGRSILADFRVGDLVTFELCEDPVSGPRATSVLKATAGR